MSVKTSMPSSWSVYLLVCGDGTFYCGCTNDLERRVRCHNAGKGARYTRGRLPVRVVAHKSCGSHGDALRLEAAIKKLPKDQKMNAFGPYQVKWVIREKIGMAVCNPAAMKKMELSLCPKGSILVREERPEEN